MKRKRSGRRISAKTRTVKKPDGKGRLDRRLSGKTGQRVVEPGTRSLAKGSIVAETPSALASILAERVAAAR